MRVLFLFVVLCQWAYAAPELKGHPDELKGFLKPDETRISLTASAEEEAYSDVATVTVIVTTEEDTLSESMKRNKAIRQQFIKSLVENGVALDKINNAKFSSSPQYGWFGKKPDSYKVVNRMSIEISSENNLQDIAEHTDKNEALVFSGVEFTHSEKVAFERKVKDKALAKLMGKKTFYEKHLKLKLTPVSFHEHNLGHYPTPGASQLEEVVVTGIRAGSRSSYSKASNPTPRTPSFDEVKYSASVTVEFKVERGD